MHVHIVSPRHWTVCVCVCVFVCFPTLSLSSVFCDVREAMEMVSGWLLASPWLSRSSPSLLAGNIITAIQLLINEIWSTYYWIYNLLNWKLEDCPQRNNRFGAELKRGCLLLSNSLLKMFAHIKEGCWHLLWWTAQTRSYRLPLCLAVVALGMWMGSFRAPRRCTVRSWITSRMCLIQSCLFSRLEALDTRSVLNLKVCQESSVARSLLRQSLWFSSKRCWQLSCSPAWMNQLLTYGKATGCF